MERNQKKGMKSWSNEDVITWFKDTLKMDEYLNIIKYEKVKGSDIYDCDMAFLNKILGMGSEQVQKFKYERNKCKYTSLVSSKLYGWGNNKSNQLCLEQSFIKKPTELPLPTDLLNTEIVGESDHIRDVFCSRSNTFLLSVKGKIYMNSNFITSKKTKKNSDTNAESNNWINITQLICIETPSSQNFFKVKKIFFSSDIVYLTGSDLGYVPFIFASKKAKGKHDKNEKDFIGIQEVIGNIQSKHKEISNFICIYEHRYLGIVEIKLSEFTQNEIPYHKVLQVKYCNEVIWDRKKRFYRFIDA